MTHARKVEKGEFCVVAGTACTCASPNDYVKNCDPSWPDQPDFVYSYTYTSTRKVGGKVRKKKVKVEKVFEAHHLLCVASVGKIICGKGNGILSIIRKTRWCVNEKVNMHAMPMWGHTVRWYCQSGGQLRFKDKPGPPPFEDIPQHDWDHDAYIRELEPELQDVVKSIKKKAQQHQVDTKNIAKQLRDLSKSFKDRLDARGGRSGGTHKGWELGRKKRAAASTGAPVTDAKGMLGGRWYYPFSMANDGEVTRTGAKGYPALDFDDTAREKLQWLAANL